MAIYSFILFIYYHQKCVAAYACSFDSTVDEDRIVVAETLLARRPQIPVEHEPGRAEARRPGR